MRTIARTVQSEGVRGGFSRAEALGALQSVPEAQHALAEQIGLENYVAAFGARQGAKLFGPARIAALPAATLAVPEGASEAQARGLEALGRAKAVRERSEGFDAVLLKGQQTLAPEASFAFTRAVLSAETPEALDAAMTSFETQVNAARP